jgi:hypothetical protein
MPQKMHRVTLQELWTAQPIVESNERASRTTWYSVWTLLIPILESLWELLKPLMDKFKDYQGTARNNY